MITSPDDAFHTTFTVRGYEIGPDTCITPGAFVLLLLEAAGQHAYHLGISLEKLQAENTTWVLNRLRVRFSHWPTVRDEVLVSTWPSGVDKMGAYREFLVKLNGQVIAWGTSSWAIIDSTTRKARPMPAEVRNLHPESPRKALTYATRIVRSLKEAEHEARYRVRESDLDANNHLNSVHYIHWALEAIPEAERVSLRLKELDVLFRAEARLDDEVVSRTVRVVGEKEQTWRHALVHDEDGRELARVETTWNQESGIRN